MVVNRRAAIGAGGLAALALAMPAAAKNVNADVAKRYIEEVWNGGKIDVLDEIGAEDFAPSEQGSAPGLAAFKARTQAARDYFTTTFPGVVFTIESLAVTSDRAIFRGLIKGASRTGKQVEATYFNELLIVDGKIKTTWAAQDDRALMLAAN